MSEINKTKMVRGSDLGGPWGLGWEITYKVLLNIIKRVG